MMLELLAIMCIWPSEMCIIIYQSNFIFWKIKNILKEKSKTNKEICALRTCNKNTYYISY